MHVLHFDSVKNRERRRDTQQILYPDFFLILVKIFRQRVIYLLRFGLAGVHKNARRTARRLARRLGNRSARIIQLKCDSSADRSIFIEPSFESSPSSGFRDSAVLRVGRLPDAVRIKPGSLGKADFT